MKQCKKVVIFIFPVLFFLLFGVIIPKIIIKDKIHIDPKESDNAILGTKMLLNNPMERVLTIKIAIDSESNEKTFVTTYTFFGLKYAITEINKSNSTNRNGSKVLWRKWDSYYNQN